MSRRGFTMLELTLAAMIGTLVLTAALGVFASLERGDRALALRAKENTGLELAAGAIERAMGTLVMETGGQAKAGPDPKLVDGAATGKNAAPAVKRARFLLESDPTPGLPGMADGAAAGSGALPGTMSAPQRLELVVARHPTPVDARPRAPEPVVDAGDAGKQAGALVQTHSAPVAVRGAFDLRPEPAALGAERPDATWALWWRPMTRRVDDAGAEVYAGEDDRAVRLATGLKSCRWSVYYEESWKTEHQTAAVLDLPAYVKLQVTTSAGLEADWLFEVAWSMGPEFAPQGNSADGDNAGVEETGGADQPAISSPATAPSAGPSSSTSAAQPQRAMPKGPARPVKPGAIKPPKSPPRRPPTGPAGGPGVPR